MEKIKSNKSHNKDIYNHIFADVKIIINRLDPIGLLKQGAPKDEYDDEVRKIVSRLKECRNIKEVQKTLYNIFKDSFGENTAGNLDLYLKAAKDIIKIKRSYEK